MPDIQESFKRGKRKLDGKKINSNYRLEVKKIIYTRAQSLLEHEDQIFHYIMKKKSPVIVALSEVRVKVSIEDFEIHNITSYSHVKYAKNRYTGGVIVYIRNDIKYKNDTDSVMVQKIIENYWCVVTGMNVKWYKGTIVVLYHSSRVEVTGGI